MIDRWVGRLDQCPPETFEPTAAVAALVVAFVADLADALVDITDDPSAVLGHRIERDVPPYTAVPGTNVGVAVVPVRNNRSSSIVLYQIVGIEPNDPAEAGLTDNPE